MKLDVSAWAFSAGLGAQWRAVTRRREQDAQRRLRAAAAACARRAPARLRRGAAHAFALILKTPGAARARLLTHPALDYWLHLWEAHFDKAISPDDWTLHLGLLAGMAAELCRARGTRARLNSSLDPHGRLHLNGGPLSFDFGLKAARRAAVIVVDGGAVTVRPAGAAAAAAPAGFCVPAGARAELRAAVVRCAPEAAAGMFVESRSWLCNHGVVMHGLVELDDAELARFTTVAREALAEAAVVEPALADEMRDLVRLLIPLKTPEVMASVSSSYTSMRGAICLSHSDSSLLQVETLIHEFCHQKVNFLTETDLLIESGQMGQVYYSPWRPDARRLRGLLLGAHAFLNVARHIHRRIAAASILDAGLVDAMRNVSLRLLQSESALSSLGKHADYTPFGAKLAARLTQECGALSLAVLRYPEGVRAETAADAAAHRARLQLGDSGLYKPADFTDRVPRAPFATPAAKRKAAAKRRSA